MSLHIQSGAIACLLDGLTAKESARALGVSEQTVFKVWMGLRAEYQARTLAHLVARVLEAA
jgi:DNA-binding CsgD family transcriptional regulator